jgi:hypothetical protein
MLVMPTERDAEAWSKDRFSPMARDTPCLAGRISDPKSRDGSNKILHKRFPGGHLTIVGANAPSGLASRPIRILLCDEVDRYPFSAGAEGDPVNLAKKRTVTFWNRKIVLVSTPTIRGASRIETAYAESDQRQYWVPCPACGTHQVLVWGQVRWESAGGSTARDGALPLQRLRRGLVGRAALGRDPQGRMAGAGAVQGHRRLPSQRDLLVLGAARGDGARLPLGAGRRRRGDEDLRQHLARRDLDGIGRGAGLAPALRPPRALEARHGARGRADPDRGRRRAEGPHRGRRLGLGPRAGELARRTRGDRGRPGARGGLGGADRAAGADLARTRRRRLPIARLAIDTGYETSAVYAWARAQGFAQVAPVKGVEGFNRASPVSGPTFVDATEGGKRLRRGARLWTVAVSTFKAETYRFLRLERPTAEEIAAGAPSRRERCTCRTGRTTNG